MGLAEESGFLLEKPLQFRCKKVGIGEEACFLPDFFGQSWVGPKPFAAAGGVASLPNDGWGKRLPAPPIPPHHRFPLILKAKDRELRESKPGLA